MMILIKNRVKLVGVKDHPEFLEEVQKLLTVTNPVYTQRLNLQLNIFNIPMNLPFFTQIDKNIIEIPIGALSKVLSDIAPKHNIEIDPEDIIDSRILGEDTGYFDRHVFKGTLRDYQNKCVESITKKTIGVIEAPTGSGKTVIFTKLIMDRKVSTIIFTHTIELARQTIKAISNFTDIPEEEIGFVGDGKFSLRPITVALYQSITTLQDIEIQNLGQFFGQVICDEVHTVAAKTFYKCINLFSSKYKFGFSATPIRADGLTEVIHFAAGDLIYKIDISTLRNVLITPEIKVYDTSYYYPLMGTDEYTALITDMATDEDRNKFILKTFEENYKDKYCVFLCSRKSQVIKLWKEIKDSHYIFATTSIILPDRVQRDIHKLLFYLMKYTEDEDLHKLFVRRCKKLFTSVLSIDADTYILNNIDPLLKDLKLDLKHNRYPFDINEIHKVLKSSRAYFTSLDNDIKFKQYSLPKSKRKKIVEDLKAKKVRHVVSTFELFSTGIDIPHLDTLFLCSPKRSESVIKQAAGRIMRPEAGKTGATIVDFNDSKIHLLASYANIRQRIYKKL